MEAGHREMEEECKHNGQIMVDGRWSKDRGGGVSV